MSEPSSPFSTVLIGADSLLTECGETLLTQGHSIEAVASGSTRVSAWARSHDIPVIEVSDDGWIDQLAAHRFQWLFAITHLHILPDNVLALPTEGAVNFHDGPLPEYGGLNAPAWAILRGDETWGVTWHLMSSDYDRGDVLSEQRFDIAPSETTLWLNTRNFEVGLETFSALIEDLAAGRQTPRAQSADAIRRNYTRLDRPAAMAVLDWRRSAAELDRLVRAVTFGPYSNPLSSVKLWAGDQVVHVTAAKTVEVAAAPPGTVLEISDERVVVACSDGALAMTEFSTSGGAALSCIEVVSQLGLRPDATLPVLTDDDADNLDDLGGRLARGERAQLRQLESLAPLELPQAHAAAADHRPVPDSIELATGLGEHDVVGAFAVALARITGTDRYHLALMASADDTDNALHAELISPAKPLEVVSSPGQTLGDLVADFGDRLDAVVERAPFARELIARHPALSSNPELRAGRLVPIAVRLDQPGPLAAGVILELERTGSGWRLNFDSALVDSGDVAVVAECVDTVAAALSTDTSVTVADVPLMSGPVRRQVVEEWNNTAKDFDRTACVHDLFEAQVDRSPHETAVIFEDVSVTYLELDERANRLAHRLIELGVASDHLVGVHVERSIELVVAVLAVHKAGGAYVPLDPTYPRDRLEHMIRDSGCRVLITQSDLVASVSLPDGVDIALVRLDQPGDLKSTSSSDPSQRPAVGSTSDRLAYCIYTSGSTGLPKGVLVEHRNAVNFFEGMDDDVPHELPATWFAVTSLSFDISVLELLYTLTRGFRVVVYRDSERSAEETTPRLHADRPIDFSLFYFSGDEASDSGSGKYRLLLDGARFADENGFKAVWTPERHFHAFGGLYPQPAVTGAAVAAITENVEIRAGSVVMPLHHPIRVAEAWSVVDNLSDGRVGVSIASGWQPNDFVLMPGNYAEAKDAMFENARIVQQLWRGETVEFDGPLGEPVPVATLPRPVQPELPIWVTTAGNPETYVQAGRIGANVLTHLLGQSTEQLAPKIEMYRQARADAGFDPDAGIVSLMVHTFVGADDDEVREAVREPLKTYLGTSFSLLKQYAWSFPAFARPDGDDGGLVDDDFKDLTPDDLDAVLEHAFIRYYESSGLFGTPERCLEAIDRFKGTGVDEVACLVDFGVDTDSVLASLPLLTEIKDAANPKPDTTAGDLDLSVAAQLERHAVTHLQCTPSMARMFSLDDDTRSALSRVENIFVGGEALPLSLAHDLAESVDGTVTNMYGPTETTIWSTTWPVAEPFESVSIGQPIANTSIYILDRHHQLLPPGIAGELWIGGEGVVRGYHDRPDLTAERFVADPFRGNGHRMYRTGDLALWKRDDRGGASLEFVGRIDHQVKVRGYRIELGEIESQLGRYDGVREVVVVVREETPGDQQLAAYLSTVGTAAVDPAAVRDHLRTTLPEVMVPAHIVVLDELPQTPNGKIDRNALPSLREISLTRRTERPHAEASSELEREVMAVWKETLGVDDLSVDDNFFDIGGHSLLVVRMHRRLKERLEAHIALTDLYRFPTIRTFAESRDGDSAEQNVKNSVDRAARRRESMRRRRTRV